MPAESLKGGRYEIREILGQGGMGVVYKCYDTLIRREVALKTIRDTPDKLALEMFYKECNVLAGMSHPNIVEIFDIGELEEPGGNKPYFVMPLLQGTPLDALIKTSSQRLTVERIVEILCQTCRGLQAAHERGLVHRDIKPSNIFVLNDDAVKIIDFGVAHIAESNTTTTAKGTLFYMAPEQIQLKPPTALSDIFALAVVAWEAFTRRRPFEGVSEREVANAILNRIPPPVSDLNPAVNQSISRVIHKAMAKQPWHRFATARELADALQKAVRNETLELFDAARIQPRVERASRAFEQGDHQFASEILCELEAEGYLDPSISLLRRQLDHAVRRKTVTQLLESARTRMLEEEYPLALQKVQEALELEAENADALALKTRIEKHRGQRQADEWLRLARQHADSYGFSHARQAIQNVLQLNATDPRAIELLAEVQRREQEYLKVREEKQKLYSAALEAYEHAELSTAMSKLQRVLELDQKIPDVSAPERGAAYQQLYNRVRSEHDEMMGAYAEARRQLDEGNFAKARALSEQYLNRYPGQALFQALQYDIEEQRRQKLSGYIVEVDRRVDAEPDLDKRAEILEEAVSRFPEEDHFQRSLRLLRDKHDLVHSIEAKARQWEENGQFSEALAQWEILRTIYPQYPGLSFEVERVTRRRDLQARGDAKARWVEEIDRHLESGEYQRAIDLLPGALGEFPGDSELGELEKLARQGLERAAELKSLVEKGQAECEAGHFDDGLGWLRKAYEMDSRNAVVRAVLVDVLVKQARVVMETDANRAASMLDAALRLDASNAPARSLRTQIEDRRREEYVEQCVARARQLQASDDLAGAMAVVEEGIRLHPSAPRLGQLHTLLKKALQEAGPVAAPEPPPVQPPEQPIGSAPAPPPVAPVLPSVAAPPVRRPGGAKRLLIGAAIAVAVFAVVFGGAVMLRKRAPVVALDVRTVPPGATVLIDQQPRGTSNCRLELAVGSHEVQAVMPGFQPAVASLTLRAGVPGVVDLTLEPLSVALRVFTDLDPARVSIDDQAPVEFQGGQFVIERLPEGKHMVRVAGVTGEASFPIEIAGAAPPKVPGPVLAKEVAAVVVINVGRDARVYASAAGAKIAIDGHPAGEAGSAGLALSGLAPGGHALEIGEGKEHRKLSFEIGAKTSLTAFLNSDREAGTLVVVTGQDGANVLIDGKPQRRVTKGGQLRIPNLAVKQYMVRVEKAGFIEMPEQQVEIRKGEDSRLMFDLKPVPTVASVLIEGARPGTQVLLDGGTAGTIGPDGGLSIPNLTPGEHTIELRLDQYRPRVVIRRFPAGETVKLAAGDVALEAIPRPAEPKPVVKTIAAAPAPTIAKLGMESWDKPAGWQTNGPWYMQRGGEFVLYKPTPNGATYTFTVMLQKGKRLRWVVQHAGERNHALFEVDGKYFYRKQVVNGKTAELAKRPHGLPRQQYLTCTMQVKVSRDHVLHRINIGGQWSVLDDWSDPQANFTQGPFGFVVHGKDEIGLSNFSVVAAQ
ncbi:MAG TPA: protein kinase [Bryobacteraceae bacterium]|nr:protein kinase [Bryobacteraceae bacterium]